MDDIRLLAATCLMWILGKTAGAPGLMDYSSHCILENGITAAEAQSIQQGNLPESEQGKCYVSCVLKTIGVVDSTGNISTIGANKLIDMYSTQSTENKKKAKQLLAQCATEANSSQNKCDVAHKMMECVGSHQKPSTRNATVIPIPPITIPNLIPPIIIPLIMLG